MACFLVIFARRERPAGWDPLVQSGCANSVSLCLSFFPLPSSIADLPGLSPLLFFFFLALSSLSYFISSWMGLWATHSSASQTRMSPESQGLCLHLPPGFSWLHPTSSQSVHVLYGLVIFSPDKLPLPLLPISSGWKLPSPLHMPSGARRNPSRVQRATVLTSRANERVDHRVLPSGNATPDHLCVYFYKKPEIWIFKWISQYLSVDSKWTS